jgi:hypothetical protein
MLSIVMSLTTTSNRPSESLVIASAPLRAIGGKELAPWLVTQACR